MEGPLYMVFFVSIEHSKLTFPMDFVLAKSAWLQSLGVEGNDSLGRTPCNQTIL